MTITIRVMGWLLAAAICSPLYAGERPLPLEPMVRPVPVTPRAKPRPANSAPVQRSSVTSVVDPARLKLRSSSLMVLEHSTSKVLVARDPEVVRPIASITKLMTAMVVLDARLRMDEILRISNADIDRLKGTHSRLQIGTQLTRREMLRLALMASENRAASALARHYPGGFAAFIKAMNRKARTLRMTRTNFVDSTGLSQKNVSTASDLTRMVKAAYDYPAIREFTTTASHTVRLPKSRQPLLFRNSNRLVQSHSKAWKIHVSKTGYTAEAGRCLVMHARIGSRPVIVVLLHSWGKLTPVGDANRIRQWMETHPGSLELATRHP